MQAFTYWETERAASSIPPYILLGIVSMRLALGEDFILLTRDNIGDYVPEDYLNKSWNFDHISGHLSPELMSIVAKSDFLRMVVVAENGGAWLDADTIVLRNFLPYLEEAVPSEKVLWHSEQFFVARPGAALLKETAQKMLQSERLSWGNPGGIKEKIAEDRSIVVPVPMDFFDSGYKPFFNATNYEVMFRTDLEAADFLVSEKQCIQKMYNSAYVKFIPRDQSVAEFLNSKMLLARIFLSINPDAAFWVEKTDELSRNLLESN